jgi:hypothetical protein
MIITSCSLVDTNVSEEPCGLHFRCRRVDVKSYNKIFTNVSGLPSSGQNIGCFAV